MLTVPREQIKKEVAEFWKQQAERKAPKECKPVLEGAALQRHLAYVKKNVDSGLIPF